jgi:drug/metabolite transporter (DMT)-like permease
MIGALGGLAAACLWGSQNALNSRVSRHVEPLTALFFALLAGLVTVLPVAIALGPPVGATPADWLWAGLAAVCAMVGLGCLFAALRRAPLALVLPIASAQGAVAAGLSVLDGESLSPLRATSLLVVVAGILAVAGGRQPANGAPMTGAAMHGAIGAAIWLAIGTCLVIGLELFALGKASAGLGPTFVIVVLRGGGLVVVTATFLVSRRAPRASTPQVGRLALAATLENLGFAAYAIGTTRAGIAVPAVLASQFSVVGALIGVTRFHERLTRRQVAGVVAIALGVAATIATTG